MKPVEFYKQELSVAASELNTIKKKLGQYSAYRLVSFLGVVGFLFGLIQISVPIAALLSIISLIAFGVSVKIHVNFSKKRKYFEARLTLLQNELDACHHIFTPFNDGEKYINQGHLYSNDLDLFGKGSLFQMINRTVTQSGENILAKEFTLEQLKAEFILEQQKALQELSSTPELLIHFRTTGSVSGMTEEDPESLKKWVKNKSYISRLKWIKPLSVILPILCCLSLVAIFWGVTSSVFIALFILNLLLVGKYIKQTNQEHQEVSSFLKVLTKYKDLLEVFESTQFTNALLNEISSNLNKNQKSASHALKELTRIVSAFDNRMNMVASVFLQGIILWDFQCLLRIRKWKNEHAESVLPWMHLVARFDALVSKGTFAFNNTGFVYPVPSKIHILQAENTGHPFIPDSVNVTNSFSIGNRGEFVIITGANMAGKSTFLRTIGINMVLAMAGYPVLAKSFEFTPTKLFTSMRTSDSLNEHESYFYAELKRLKELIEMLEAGEAPLILLDEILKGTNSVDKQRGSQLALMKIISLKGTGIIATHDLALTEMEKDFPKQLKNMCFEIEIDKAKINFDYKLYDGVTQNMNAMLLMEQMGII
jgi:DNA mismatch repair ATPase MutS